MIATAQIDPNKILQNFASELIAPLIGLLWIVALIVFIWGFVIFLKDGTESTGEARARGKKHMIWGTVGMFFLFTASGIVYFLKDIGTWLFTL